MHNVVSMFGGDPAETARLMASRRDELLSILLWVSQRDRDQALLFLHRLFSVGMMTEDVWEWMESQIAPLHRRGRV